MHSFPISFPENGKDMPLLCGMASSTGHIADGTLFTAGALKVIALVAMTIDHVALFFIDSASPAYLVMRTLGRVAFPIFAFLISEGYVHSHDRVSYGLSLLIFAVISDVPWCILHEPGSHNVLFTLLAGFLGICCVEKCNTVLHSSIGTVGKTVGILPSLFLFVMLCFTCSDLHTDYGYHGFLLVVVFHLLRDDRLSAVLIGLSLMVHEILPGQILAFSFIYFYNGKRGLQPHGRWKYLFYAYYPLHMAVICIVRLLLLR